MKIEPGRNVGPSSAAGKATKAAAPGFAPAIEAPQRAAAMRDPACRAVRDNPEAAAAMGVNVARTKVIAFTLTSVLAGIAGMVYAFVDNTVNPPIFGLENAFLLLFMVIIGGAGRHAGAVLGAVLLYLLPFALSPVIGHHHALVFGVLMVGAILLQPRGLIALYERHSPGQKPH